MWKNIFKFFKKENSNNSVPAPVHRCLLQRLTDKSKTEIKAPWYFMYPLIFFSLNSSFLFFHLFCDHMIRSFWIISNTKIDRLPEKAIFIFILFWFPAWSGWIDCARSYLVRESRMIIQVISLPSTTSSTSLL